MLWLVTLWVAAPDAVWESAVPNRGPATGEVPDEREDEFLAENDAEQAVVPLGVA